MSEIELFKIALKYIEKGYSYEDLKWGDDLYSATPEEKEYCAECYDSIQEEGLKWAYEYIKK